MRLLLFACFLGSWSTDSTNTLSTAPLATKDNTAVPTQETTSHTYLTTTNVTTQSSSATQETTSSARIEESTSNFTTKEPTVIRGSSTTAPEVINPSATSLTTETTVKSPNQHSTTTVQLTNVTSTSAPHQKSSASTTLDSTTQESVNTTVFENKSTTRANESEIAPSTIKITTPDPGQVTPGSTQLSEVSNSTWLNSTPTSVTVTRATISNFQANQTTLEAPLKGLSIGTTDESEVTATQESETTESTPENAISGTQENPSKTGMQSKVYCVEEPSNTKNSLTLTKSINCNGYQKEYGERLAELLCSKISEKENLNIFNHCEIKLSPVEEFKEKKLNVDISFKVDESKIKKALTDLKGNLKELDIQFSPNKGTKNERQEATELKKLIAMVVTGSLLLLVFLSAIVYRCSQRKSQHKKDECLTEEMRAVDNGCHDNPAMDHSEIESEMQEKKPNSKANYMENTDIVPYDNLIMDDLEEQDTRL
ncbi:podocalyxin isoform X2 [Carcharodon carcharias]|uniref:podocalyxin isoform X2 n=1 Tax=Carcharodon carcharias TaxID=13397 RepID=UPI001B7F5D8A|nr:podocalyxin isoform X2 [Carcharodon carcharias]